MTPLGVRARAVPGAVCPRSTGADRGPVNRWPVQAATAALLVALVLASGAARTGLPDGLEIIEQSLRQQAPAADVFEEQVLVTSDPAGQATVRTLRYYAHTDARGTQRLLVLDTPAILRGLRVLVTRAAPGGARRGPPAASLVFGSNYTVADLEGEQPPEQDYALAADQTLARVPHWVVLATPRVSGGGETGTRRIYLRKDNLYVSRVERLDATGAVVRRVTFKDPRPDESGAWRAGMTLIEDLREERRTLLKVEHRAHGADYVPAALFQTPQGRGP